MGTKTRTDRKRNKGTKGWQIKTLTEAVISIGINHWGCECTEQVVLLEGVEQLSCRESHVHEKSVEIVRSVYGATRIS